MTVSVDNVYSEQWSTSGDFSVLASSAVFVGGSEGNDDHLGHVGNAKSLPNFVGCMKEVSKGCCDSTLKPVDSKQQKSSLWRRISLHVLRDSFMFEVSLKI